MKTLFITILFTPFFLFSQGPSFLVTDNNGTVWNSNDLLEQGTTIVVTFFSPSTTCWPSVNHIINTNVAYEKFNPCNDIFFIQVAQWGGEFTVSNFVEDFGNPEIPYVIGYYQGQTLTIEWMDWGLQWAYESWLLRTDGSYEYVELSVPIVKYGWELPNQVGSWKCILTRRDRVQSNSSYVSLQCRSKIYETILLTAPIASPLRKRNM